MSEFYARMFVAIASEHTGKYCVSDGTAETKRLYLTNTGNVVPVYSVDVPVLLFNTLEEAEAALMAAKIRGDIP